LKTLWDSEVAKTRQEWRGNRRLRGPKMTFDVSLGSLRTLGVRIEAAGVPMLPNGALEAAQEKREWLRRLLSFMEVLLQPA
jgi:hypothetical protein